MKKKNPIHCITYERRINVIPVSSIYIFVFDSHAKCLVANNYIT